MGIASVKTGIMMPSDRAMEEISLLSSLHLGSERVSRRGEARGSKAAATRSNLGTAVVSTRIYRKAG